MILGELVNRMRAAGAWGGETIPPVFRSDGGLYGLLGESTAAVLSDEIPWAELFCGAQTGPEAWEYSTQLCCRELGPDGEPSDEFGKLEPVRHDAWLHLARAEMRRRAAVKREMDENPRVKMMVIARAVVDPWFRWHNFAWLVAPREVHVLLDQPFVLYPSQAAALWWLRHWQHEASDRSKSVGTEVIAVDKARNLGLTLLVLQEIAHTALVTPGYLAAVGAGIADQADDGSSTTRSTGSHIGKLCAVLANLDLADWPALASTAPHGKVVLGNDAQIHGFNANTTTLRSKRFLAVLADEMDNRSAREQIALVGATSELADLVIWVSTRGPNGPGTTFGRLAESGGDRTLRLPWPSDPSRGIGYWQHQLARYPRLVALREHACVNTDSEVTILPMSGACKVQAPEDYHRLPIVAGLDLGGGDDSLTALAVIAVEWSGGMRDFSGLCVTGGAVDSLDTVWLPRMHVVEYWGRTKVHRDAGGGNFGQLQVAAKAIGEILEPYQQIVACVVDPAADHNNPAVSAEAVGALGADVAVVNNATGSRCPPFVPLADLWNRRRPKNDIWAAMADMIRDGMLTFAPDLDAGELGDGGPPNMWALLRQARRQVPETAKSDDMGTRLPASGGGYPHVNDWSGDALMALYYAVIGVALECAPPDARRTDDAWVTSVTQ